MSIVLLVYLVSIVNSIKAASALFFVLLTIVYCGYLFIGAFYNSEQGKDENKIKFHPKKATSVLLLIGCISLFTPTEKTIYIMAAASIAQDIANSPKTAATLDKVYKIVDKKLDEQLSEGIDKATKKVEEAAK